MSMFTQLLVKEAAGGARARLLPPRGPGLGGPRLPGGLIGGWLLGGRLSALPAARIGDLLDDLRIRDPLAGGQHHGDAFDRVEYVNGGRQDAEGIHGGAHRTVAVMWQSGE